MRASYDKLIDAMHEHARELEALREDAHALAARKNADAYAEKAKEVEQDARRIGHQRDRHLREVARRMRGENDAN